MIRVNKTRKRGNKEFTIVLLAVILLSSLLYLSVSSLQNNNNTGMIIVELDDPIVQKTSKIGLESITETVVSQGQYGISALPIITSIILNSTFGTNLTSENLTVYYDVTDLDGDNVKNITNWYVDGSSTTVLNMPFEGGSNSTYTKDYSGYSNDGTVINSTTYNPAGGYGGFGAYEFDGIDDAINIPDSPSLNVTGTDFSIEVRVLFNNLNLSDGTGMDIIDKADPDDAGYQLDLFREDAEAGPMLFFIIDDNSAESAMYNYSKLSTGQWYHIIGTYDGEFVRLYIDGVEVNNTAETYVMQGSNTGLHIGSNNDGHFNGSIDEVRIYNKALSPQQIKALYNNMTDLIVSQETTKGETWKACITPNDGADDGSQVCSTNLTVFDTNSIPPNVTGIRPTFGEKFNRSSNIIISALVEDDIAISDAYSNISSPDGNLTILDMDTAGTVLNFSGGLNDSDSVNFSGSSYNVTINCYDFTDNTTCTLFNYTFPYPNCVNATFDDQPPGLGDYDVDLGAMLCVNETYGNYELNYTRTVFDAGNNVTLGFCFTSVFGVDFCSGWVLSSVDTEYFTVQNKTVTGANFETTFTNTSDFGRYNITIYANDTQGNINSSQKTYFIVNIPPNSTNVSILSSDPNNRTNGTLTANWDFYDLDADTEVKNQTRWYNNTLEVANLANFVTLSSGNATKGENWFVSVRVYDGTIWSTWQNSTTITLQNTFPYLDQIIPNQTWDQHENNTNAFDLDDYFTDIDGDIITYNFTKLGSNISITIHANNSVSFNQQPDWFGTEYIIFTANDTTTDFIQSNNITLNVNQNTTNQAPINNQTIPNQTWNEDQENTNAFDLDQYFNDPDADNLTFSFTKTGTNINVMIHANNSVSFNQTADWFGTEIITFIANDSMNTTESNNITLNVTNINDPPSLNQPIPNQTWPIDTNNNDVFDLDNYFSDIDSSITYNFSKTGSNITVTIDAGNSVSFTPDAGWSGIEYIVFNANDTINITESNNITLNVTANATAPAPFCGDGTCSGSESCTTCNADCGLCESSGGGGGGSDPPPPDDPPPEEPPAEEPPPDEPDPEEDIVEEEVVEEEVTEEEVEEEVTEEVTEETSPTEESPTIINTFKNLFAKSRPSLSETACINVTTITEIPVEKRTTELEATIPKGYSVAVEPFDLTCQGDTLDLTLNIPSNFIDLKALRCKQGICEDTVVEEVTELRCGDTIVEEYRKEKTLELDQLPITIKNVKADLITNRSLTSGKYKVKLLRDTGIFISMEMPSEALDQPQNPNLKIISTPLVLDLNKNTQTPLEITMPYVVDPEIDISTVAIYARNESGWNYIGGKINTEDRTVTAVVDDVSLYQENNHKARFALIGLICRNCRHSAFENIYWPAEDSRTAVIVIHGLGSSPATFNHIINDIRLTKQPWQAWTYGYPSNLSIEENALDFAENIQKHNNEYDRIYIVAHSLGAVITQQALYNSYTENQNNPDKSAFINKVRKAILIGSPNDGVAGNELFQNLFRYFVNQRTGATIFDADSRGVQELMSDKLIPTVPDIDYYVVAGTRPYSFNAKYFKVTTEELFEYDQKNDGIVTVDSAQHIGGQYINDSCSNYWEINETHTQLIDNPISRRIIERIVAQEIAEDLEDSALLGYNQYFDLHIEDCSPDDKYVVIGKKINPKKVADPTGCSCGNGYCGVDEDEVSCPADCARILTEENVYLALDYIIILGLFSTILGLYWLKFRFFRIKKYRKP